MPAARRGAIAWGLCRTQLEYAPSGRPLGLRYGDCVTVLRTNLAALGVPRGQLGRWLEELRVVERAVVEARREIMEQEQANERTR